METDRKWVIVRIDGKIAAISTDYRLLASITAGLAADSHTHKSRNKTGRTKQKTDSSNRAGVRAVAHAIGLNPVSVVIPCHLVIPKESIDKIQDIQKKAETTIFKGDDLCLKSILSDSSIDFGEYGLGRGLKRKLIQMELA